MAEAARTHRDPSTRPHGHQFEDLGQERAAGDLGMWAFLLTEIMFFGGLFVSYAVYRWSYPEAFAAGSHHLDVRLGAINTSVLLGSSLTMALAVRASQLGQRRRIISLLVATILLGSVFLGIKGLEYSHKYHEHLVPGPHFHLEGHGPEAQLFFSLYFAMTGLHALHMVIGIVLLGSLALLYGRGRFAPDREGPITVSGLYWHFVDIVWIFLFPMLYLLGRHG